MEKAEEIEKSSACDDENDTGEEDFATIFDNIDNADSTPPPLVTIASTMYDDDDDDDDDNEEKKSTTSVCVAATSSADTVQSDCYEVAIDDKKISRPARSSLFVEVPEPADCLLETTLACTALQKTLIVWESKQNAKRLSKNAMEAIIFSACARTDSVVLRCVPNKTTIMNFCPTFNPDTLAAFDVHCDEPRIVVINYKRTPLVAYTVSKTTPLIFVYSIEGKRLGWRFKTYFYKPKVSRVPPVFVSANSYEMANEILIQFIKKKLDDEKLSTGSQWVHLYDQANEIDKNDKRSNHFFVQ